VMRHTVDVLYTRQRTMGGAALGQGSRPTSQDGAVVRVGRDMGIHDTEREGTTSQ
jgi:hypothetical protein